MLLFKRNFFRLYYQNYNYSVIKTLEKSVKESVTQVKNNSRSSKEILQEYGYGYGNKLLYNSVVDQIKTKLGYRNDFVHKVRKDIYRKNLQHVLERIQPLPVSLKYYSEEHTIEEEHKNSDLDEKMLTELENEVAHQSNSTTFPLDNSYCIDQNTYVINDEQFMSLSKASSVDVEIREKYELLKNTKNWMSSYDNFENDLEEDTAVHDWTVNYGTPDPNCRISNVPCGGCGAFLHCKDTAIPGYIPSEIFKNNRKKGGASLEALICQRCYFLKEHNLALDVQVSPEDYPTILKTIRHKRALVIVMVDLTDFPCSIWPGIADILGAHVPIFVVGNKIDLLPKDDERYLSRIKTNLLNHMKLFGFGSLNVLDVALISAKTGYGIEDLITSLHSKWEYKGDVYLVGCTNVGKSSLFNALLNSDFCKTQAKDLIQRATTSLWPGTTLNLLKFPILRPSHHRLYLRQLRMNKMKNLSTQEKKLRNEELKKSNSIEHATLIGHIGQTFGKKVSVNENSDTFSTTDRSFDSGRVFMGVNETDPQYAQSKWCFDTPGVIQPDQILGILTTDELMYVLPRELITPETFILKPGMTMYIAGLARLDYTEGDRPVRFTVFRSNALPITVCYNQDSDKLYSDFVGTEFFKVPINNGDRLSKWPGLELTKTFTCAGVNRVESSKDVVLSNAGWIAITCTPGHLHKFEAWTPHKKGVYVRDCLLPKAVTLRGDKIRNSVAYRPHKLI